MSVRCLKCMKEYENGISKCPHCGYVEGANEDEQCYLPPRTILKGRYMIGCCLGSGGFGVTYVAWDSLLEKKVAIKEYLPSELATRTIGDTRVTVHDTDCLEKYQQGMRSFLDESRRLAKFNNCKGIVSIYDCFDENGTAYIVMECLEGKTLQQLINERKKLPFNEVLPLFIDVLEALEVVHEAGMMHRDIAPDNIFVCNDGTAKLIDFGAARYMTTTHSRSLSMILKIGYAPIEQYTKHGNQGPWTDIYAVAASLYHAITGVVPPDSYDRVEEDKLKKPSLLARKLPKHAETAILNALNIIETNRTQTAKQFADELKGDIDVSRIREKIQHEDTGRIAKWMKYTAAGIAAAIAGFGILFVATGGKLFRLDEFFVPEGMSRVPHVINESVSDADTTLNDSLLHMVIGDRVTDSFFENNFVLLQNPRQGNVAYIGSIVSVTASMKPDEYFIPDLSNYTKDAAVDILEKAGFNVIIEEDQSNLVAPGAVMKQTPLGNTMAFEGESITLVINSGSKDTNTDSSVEISVPYYVGKQIDKAKADALKKKIYIAISSSEYSDTVPKGEIISQSPNAGETLYGNVLYVTVSLGKRTIITPNLYYLSEKEANAKIVDRLLSADIKYVESSLVEAGLVVGQKPLPGKSIYEGGKVTIYISSGYKVKVPNVVGMTQKDAQNTLTSASLSYAVTFENSDTVPKGDVMLQSVKAGTEVSQGTVIAITVSSGNKVIKVNGISLNKSALNLEYGEVYTLVATISPKNATTTTTTWESSNNSVASVSNAGVITAQGIGKAVITVRTKDGGYTAQCTVTVDKVLSSLKVESKPTKLSYYYGESADYSGLVLMATYSDGSKENVASSKSTTISGFDSSRGGDKTITATYEYNGHKKTAQFIVHVRNLDAIEVTKKPSNIYFDLNSSAPSEYPGMEVTAYYDDSSSRVVKPTTIDGFNSSRSGTCVITVIYKEEYSRSTTFDITIKGDLSIRCISGDAHAIMDNGASYTLVVDRGNDYSVNDYEYTWSSSDENVIAVTSTSNTREKVTVTAKKAGSVQITVKDKFDSKGTIVLSAYGPWTTSWVANPVMNESKYEYKSKDEYCTSSSSSLAGWDRYDVTSENIDTGNEYISYEKLSTSDSTRRYLGEYIEKVEQGYNTTYTEYYYFRYYYYNEEEQREKSGRCIHAFNKDKRPLVKREDISTTYQLPLKGGEPAYCDTCGFNNIPIYIKDGKRYFENGSQQKTKWVDTSYDRTVYRYIDRTTVYTYHYTRKVYIWREKPGSKVFIGYYK